VVFQFALSIVLIAGTLVAQKQLHFMQNKRLGLEKERVVTIERAFTLQTRQPAFVDRIRQLPGVAAAGASDGVFEEVRNQVFVPDGAPDDQSRTINFMQVGYGFVDAMGIDVVAGRPFDPARPADSSTALINRAAAEALGWEKLQGHRLRTPGEGGETYEVIGVAAVVALPVAYVAMQRWLQDFAYRTELGIGVFVGAGVLACAIALLTVSYQALRAARVDPATTLRDE
jgi:putative ABC transport system permease protein